MSVNVIICMYSVVRQHTEIPRFKISRHIFWRKLCCEEECYDGIPKVDKWSKLKNYAHFKSWFKIKLCNTMWGLTKN